MTATGITQRHSYNGRRKRRQIEKLAITFERSTMRVCEQGNCFTFRGMQCHFGGNLKRERSGGGAVSLPGTMGLKARPEASLQHQRE